MGLRRFNNLLVICIVVINAYVIVLPFTPTLLYAQATHSGKPQQLSQKIQQAADKPSPNDVAAAGRPNELIIPSMVLDQPVLEGRDTYAVLNKGVLRWPASSTPDKGGNTVLLAHRFTYTNPRGAFYHLDKIQVGDEIGLVWQGVAYRYTVTTTAVVPATQTTILAATDDSRLTLFTCTPLWSPKDRLVVTAELQPHTNQGDVL